MGGVTDTLPQTKQPLLTAHCSENISNRAVFFEGHEVQASIKPTTMKS